MGFAVDVIFLHSISVERVKLGWTMPDFGQANVKFMPDTEPERYEFLKQFPVSDYDIQLVNGFYINPEIATIIKRSKQSSTPVGVLSEAPFNGFFGVRRWLKYMYLLFVVPLLAQKAASHASMICCLSGSSASTLGWLGWFGFREDRIYPFGYFSEEPSEKRLLADQIGTPPLLVCTGYLTRNKGHMILLRALKRLQENKIDFKCIITGYGPEKERLQAFIGEHKMGNVVQLIGVVSADELNRIQAQADIFVAPGYEEPWAIRINEALQSGSPVVLSDRIGAAELIRASGGGATFRSGDDHDLANTLADLLCHSEKIIALKKRVLAYRERIHPREAARYLEAIIFHVTAGAERPASPIWLKPVDISESE